MCVHSLPKSYAGAVTKKYSFPRHIFYHFITSAPRCTAYSVTPERWLDVSSSIPVRMSSGTLEWMSRLKRHKYRCFFIRLNYCGMNAAGMPTCTRSTYTNHYKIFLSRRRYASFNHYECPQYCRSHRPTQPWVLFIGCGTGSLSLTAIARSAHCSHSQNFHRYLSLKDG